MADGLGDRGGQLTRALESNCARESYRKIGEVAVSSAADTNSVDLQHAVEARYRVVNLRSNARRRSIEQSIDSAARQSPAYRYHHTGDEQSGNGIGVAEPINVEGSSKKHECQTQHHNASRPDVGGKMEGISLQRLTVVFVGDTTQRSRAPPIRSHRKQHHGEGGDRGLDLYAAKKEPDNGFVDDPGTSKQE